MRPGVTPPTVEPRHQWAEGASVKADPNLTISHGEVQFTVPNGIVGTHRYLAANRLRYGRRPFPVDRLFCKGTARVGRAKMVPSWMRELVGRRGCPHSS